MGDGGIIILGATRVTQNNRYPTDTSPLNAARESAEAIRAP